MATTTNYSWPTPDNTDPSTDGALAMRTLGSAIDTTVFNNANATGNPIGYVSGSYYQAPFYNSSSNVTATNNQVIYRPFFVTTSSTWDRISVKSGSTYSVSGNVNVGIYNNANGKPSTLVTSSNVTVAAASTNYEATISTTLAKGWYWLALQKTTGTFGMAGTIQSGGVFQWDAPLINNSMGNTSQFVGWSETAGSAALPATAGTVAQVTTTTIAHIQLRKA